MNSLAVEKAIVNWQDSYSVGMAEIDDQHKALFATINRLWAAIVGKGDPASVLGLLDELERYTVSHFSAEEVFMSQIGYPDFAAHKKLHALFVQRIAQERAGVSAGKSLSLDLLHFLKDWLIQHILVEDQRYAAFCRESTKKNQGLTALFKRFWQ